MARKASPLPARISPRTADDFRLIRGIGPVLNSRLHTAGIHTFDQLASLSPAKLAARVRELSPAQIARQEWIAQARRLASHKTRPGRRRKEEPKKTIRQHYETFTFEFLLDETNKTRRSRLTHVQSGDTDTWSTWDPERLVDFLVRHTGERLPRASDPAPSRSSTLALPQSSAGQAEPVAAGGETATEPSLPPAAPASEAVLQAHPTLETPHNQTSHREGSPARTNEVRPGGLCLLGWQTLAGSADEPALSIPHYQAFHVRLTLGFEGMSAPGAAWLNLTGTLYARRFGSRDDQPIGEIETIRRTDSAIELTLGEAVLSRGLYHLGAMVRAERTDNPARAEETVMSFFEGGLLQIY